jgi:hypothetical protein
MRGAHARTSWNANCRETNTTNAGPDPSATAKRVSHIREQSRRRMSMKESRQQPFGPSCFRPSVFSLLSYDEIMISRAENPAFSGKHLAAGARQTVILFSPRHGAPIRARKETRAQGSERSSRENIPTPASPAA